MEEQALPLNLAHRGARRAAPENTLAAFRAAEEQGADGVELDIFRCASGELVVTHDNDLSIWSNGRGLVTETPLSALKELDFGSHFSSKFANERMPTLQEVIELLGRGMFINIEVKTATLRPLAEVDALIALIAANNLYARVLVSSFNPLVLYHLKRRDARINTGLLFHFRFPLYARSTLKASLKLAALHPEAHLARPRFITRAQQRGLQINVWTVNEEVEMRRFVELGVDAIITDYPDRLRAVLNGAGKDYSLPPVNRKMSKIGRQ